MNKAERNPEEPVSHGYCPSCADKAFEEIRRNHPPLDYPSSVALSV